MLSQAVNSGHASSINVDINGLAAADALREPLTVLNLALEGETGRTARAGFGFAGSIADLMFDWGIEETRCE